MVEVNEAERKNVKRNKRKEDTLKDFWDNIKHPNFES